MKTGTINQLSFFEPDVKGNNYAEMCYTLSNEKILTPDQFGKAVKNSILNSIDKPIRTVALFSGAGGLDIGFCDSGFSLVESVELEQKFVQTMLSNQSSGKYFAGAKITCEDIKNYQPSFSHQIDFVIGGPPCQSFSAAGRRAAGVRGTKDDRGNLFEEYVRILKKLKPRGFLFENVYGLLGAENGESIKKITAAFRGIGYDTAYRILDAADYGVPQHRERVIIVGSLDKKFKFPKPTHGPDSFLKFPHYSALKALNHIEQLEKPTVVNGRFGHMLNEVPPGLNYSFFTEKMGHPNPIFAWRSKFSDFLYKADPLKPIRTLKASGGQYTGPFHWDNRHFTIDELKRLQTFPDDYNIIGNRVTAIKQIGNSVPPQFARILALSVLDQLFDIKPPFPLHYLEENEKLTFRQLKSERTNQYFQKAASAISNTKAESTKRITSKKYKVDLAENFRLTKNAKSPIEVLFKPTNKRWVFELNNAEATSRKNIYRIEIKKVKGTTLFLSVNEVHLISNSELLTDYTVLWKVFERVLAENKIKADLVQLNGYYQYTNDVSYTLTKYANMPTGAIWKLIESILTDPTIGQIRSIRDLALSYKIKESDLIAYFYELRKIGFEIRNNNTNPEIADGSYLVPYRFPTLTPLSVQLKKSLRANG